MRCLWFGGDFGQPVSWSSGLCSCVAGEFAWYVLPWDLLALVWCLVSVSVWRYLMSSCQLMFLGVRSSLESGFGLKPPASSYWSYFYSISKLLLYSTIDKTSTLKMKSFSTMRVTQGGSQCYMEKRRGRRELEVTQMTWGGISRGESGLASNPFLMCTPQLDRSEMFTELYREEKEEERDRGGQEDKRGEWKGRRQIQPVVSSLSILHCLEHTEIHRVG